MELENKFGLMEQNMLDNGNKVKLMGKGNLHIQMEMFLKEYGKMER
jgi:hypothetical protein